MQQFCFLTQFLYQAICTQKTQKGFIGEGEEMEGGDGKEGSESECWKDKNHVV